MPKGDYVVIVDSNSGSSYVHGYFETKEQAEDYASRNLDERGCIWRAALLLPAIDHDLIYNRRKQ